MAYPIFVALVVAFGLGWGLHAVAGARRPRWSYRADEKRRRRAARVARHHEHRLRRSR